MTWYGYDAGRTIPPMGLCLLTIILQAISSPCLAESPVAVSWERDGAKQKPDPSQCTPLERALILPTIPSQRGVAIAQLERTPVIELDPRDVAKMVELPGSNEVSDSASRVVSKTIAELEERKRQELIDHIGSWSLADQSRLEELETLKKKNGTLSSLKPFLVRAIAKNEFTGEFIASLCGKTLEITHASLGKSTPASVPLPVVVFLNSAPTNVYLSWEMAE
jgi:hypothetical protein